MGEIKSSQEPKPRAGGHAQSPRNRSRKQKYPRRYPHAQDLPAHYEQHWGPEALHRRVTPSAVEEYSAMWQLAAARGPSRACDCTQRVNGAPCAGLAAAFIFFGVHDHPHPEAERVDHRHVAAEQDDSERSRLDMIKPSCSGESPLYAPGGVRRFEGP